LERCQCLAILLFVTNYLIIEVFMDPACFLFLRTYELGVLVLFE
jgi:hypothetical protein